MGLLSNPKSREKLMRIIHKYGNKLCILCYVVGIAWFVLLAYTELNAHTYFSENALLPGLVEPDFHHPHGAGDYLRELKDEVSKQKSVPELRYKMPTSWLSNKFNELGLEVFVHNYTFKYPFNMHNGQVFTGQNVYCILRAPKTAGTEALVLSSAYKSEPFSENTLGGIALMLGLANAFRQHTYWAKDIIFLVTDNNEIGMHAWLSAYHHTYNEYIYPSELFGRSGSIQAALNIEIGTEHVNRLDVRIEGLNGQLPNLDLVNTVVRLCKREGITPTLHKRADYWNLPSMDGFLYSLKTMLLFMSQLASGSPSGNHGLFHRYNIEAVTLRGIKLKGMKAISGFNEMGRVVEGIFRSLNNLLERFHQSFFFYLLSSVERYASIGLYMPPFGILALPIAIKALALWISCGSSATGDESSTAVEAEEKNAPDSDEKISQTKETKPEMADLNSSGSPVQSSVSVKHIFHYIPLMLVSSFIGICAYCGSYYFIAFGNKFNMTAESSLTAGLCALQVVALTTPLMLHSKQSPNHVMDLQLLKSVALLMFGVLVGANAIINVSMAFFIATITIPVILFIEPNCSRFLKFVQMVLLVVVSPLAVVALALCSHMLLKKSAVSFDDLHEHIGSSLLHSAVQFEMYDNWTYGIICLAYLPNWVMFWNILLSRPVA